MLQTINSLFINGYTGTGKSFFLRKIINSIIERNDDSDQLIIVDPKQIEFHKYRTHPKVALFIKENAAKVFINFVETELAVRMANIENKQSNAALPKLHIFIDEYAELVYQDKKVEPLLEQLTKMQSALNIVFYIAMQYHEYPTFLTKNVNTVIKLYYTDISAYPHAQVFGVLLDFRNTLVTGDNAKVTKYLNLVNDEIDADLVSFVLPYQYEHLKALIKKRLASNAHNDLYCFLKVTDIDPNDTALPPLFYGLFQNSAKVKMTFVIPELARHKKPAFLDAILNTHIHFNCD